jgi:manganese efflux pump family protein
MAIFSGFSMTIATDTLIAVGVSADAVAVALCSGLLIKHLRLNKALKIALFFGGFQAMMTLLGWFMSLGIQSLIQNVDHWIVFALLGGIGGKMIYEAINEDDNCERFDPTNNHTLMVLAFATSIDALAVGISFGALQTDISKSTSIIGSITFLLSLLAVFVGHRFGNFLGRRIEIVGGLVLIGIGAKILFEHLTTQGI